jgi:hypothetical protein
MRIFIIIISDYSASGQESNLLKPDGPDFGCWLYSDESKTFVYHEVSLWVFPPKMIMWPLEATAAWRYRGDRPEKHFSCWKDRFWIRTSWISDLSEQNTVKVWYPDKCVRLSDHTDQKMVKWQPFCFYDLITGPVISHNGNKDCRHFILLFDIRTQICLDIAIFRLLGVRILDLNCMHIFG